MKENDKQSVDEVSTMNADFSTPTDEQELKKVLDVEVLDI